MKHVKISVVAIILAFSLQANDQDAHNNNAPVAEASFYSKHSHYCIVAGVACMALLGYVLYPSKKKQTNTPNNRANATPTESELNANNDFVDIHTDN